MASYRTARIIPVAFILIIAALAIAALLSMARAIFFPDAVSNLNNVKTGHDSLISTTDGRSVKMTVRGPIVVEEDARSYEIIVSPEDRRMLTYQGYLQTILEKIDLPNNIPAYQEFVYALDEAGMMNNSELKGDYNDKRGVCAKGYLYRFGIYNDGKIVKELWTTSCADARGSLGVKSLAIRKLFNYQIPESKKIIDKLWR